MKAKDFDYQHFIVVNCLGLGRKGRCQKPPHKHYYEKGRPSLARSLAAARRHVARMGHDVSVEQYTIIGPCTRQKLEKVAESLFEGKGR